MDTQYILKIDEIGCSFSGFKAVDGISLNIEEGSIHAIIGPNGAGKTTFFNILTGFVKPTQGRIIFESHDITGAAPEVIANLGIVRSFQISSVFTDLTVLQNVRIALQKKHEPFQLNFWRSSKSLQKYNDEALRVLARVRLEDYSNSLVAELPYGLKRALELATTIALDPKIILLDEPTQGMGHEDVDHIIALIRDISENRTIVMVEHNMNVVSSISNRITVLARGRKVVTGNYEQVSNNPEVIEAYMGKRNKSSNLKN